MSKKTLEETASDQPPTFFNDQDFVEPALLPSEELKVPATATRYRVMHTELKLDGERWVKWLTLCPLGPDHPEVMVGAHLEVAEVEPADG